MIMSIGIPPLYIAAQSIVRFMASGARDRPMSNRCVVSVLRAMYVSIFIIASIVESWEVYPYCVIGHDVHYLG